MRKGLVVFQFTISIFLFVSTMVVLRQMDYFQSRILGYDREQVAVVRNVRLLGNQTRAFKEKLRELPGVLNVSGSSHFPALGFSNWGIRPEGLDALTLDIYICDENFLETLGMEIVQGRFFSGESGANDDSLVLNEEAVRQLGWTGNALGKSITVNQRPYRVVGVVRDFHYESLHQRVDKLGLLHLSGRPQNRESYVAARIHAENVTGILSRIREAWNSFLPNVPFEYSFLDEDYYNLYSSEQRVKKLALVFSILAIFISALGLFGLSAFSAEQRTKEIGIRKVLGASAPGVMMMLSREFTRWVLLSNLIAWPAAYIAMSKWLENFAYRIPLRADVFILSAVLALTIALFTVSYQAVKSAVANPSDSLRYE